VQLNKICLSDFLHVNQFSGHKDVYNDYIERYGRVAYCNTAKEFGKKYVQDEWIYI